jgi:hypothetical protein
MGAAVVDFGVGFGVGVVLGGGFEGVEVDLGLCFVVEVVLGVRGFEGVEVDLGLEVGGLGERGFGGVKVCGC